MICVQALSRYVIKPVSNQAPLSRLVQDSDHSPLSADTYAHAHKHTHTHEHPPTHGHTQRQQKQQQLRTTPPSAPVLQIANMFLRSPTADFAVLVTV